MLLFVHWASAFHGKVVGRPRAVPSCCATSAIPDGSWAVDDDSRLHVGVAGKTLTFESGSALGGAMGMAKQASGSVTVVQGDTHIFCAACFEKVDTLEPIDFTPLRVDYFERSSAAGLTKGGFIKRDGRPSDHETLAARIIDRPIRPLIDKGWSLETQARMRHRLPNRTRASQPMPWPSSP
eukprot:5550119-Prymnesium_polylepis.1